jgi:glycine oxidase
MGFPVKVFDARECGREASWAGAGMLAPGGEILRDSSVARMALASLRLYDAFVEELQAASGLAIDYRHCGALELAFTEEEAVELERRAVAQAAIGIRSEARGSGRFYPDDAVVDPRDVNAALKVACLAAGVEFHEHEPVLEILPSGVRTAAGDYEADAVVLAAGAWSSELYKDLPGVQPVRGHLIAYEAPAVRLDSLLRHGHTYLLQRGSGIIVAGSSTEHVGFERSLDEGVIAEIHGRVCKLLPGLATARIVDRWNGLRPHIKGEVPAVGRIAGTKVWAACGHYRNGILLAPETARVVSCEIRN